MTLQIITNYLLKLYKMKKSYLLKSIIYFLFIGLFSIQTFFAQNDDTEYLKSCTCIMVGKDASTDGSVMTSHTCDAYYRTFRIG